MSRRAIVTGAVLVVGAAVVMLLFTPMGDPVRDLLNPREPGTASGGDAGPRSAMPPGQEPPRGTVTIDPRRQQLIGVRTEAVRRESLAPEIRAVGTVLYNETRQVEVNTKVAGWIRDLFAGYTGKPVRAGEPLFTLYSPELLATQNEYLLAHRGHALGSGSDVQAVRTYSERLVDAARQRLLLWDVSPAEVHALEDTGEATGVVTFRSPASGVLVEKNAVEGMRVMAGEMLFRIADLSTVWVEADVYEQDLALVRVGQRAAVTLDAYPGETFNGRVAYIYPSLDEATRTARVRLELPNRDMRLRPGMYAQLALEGSAASGLTVPANAVLDSGTQQFVFVAEGDGVFTPRPVKVGRRTADRVELLDGVSEGDQVAVGANFFLDSESQLRAGLQNYRAPAAQDVPATAGDDVAMTFRSTTDPPRTGENTFEVTLKDPSGQPVTDAEVSVQLFMPAMPTMNMPAMRNETRLAHVGSGLYRGSGQVMMGGRWDVTVTATRAGQRIGSQQFPLIAR